MDYRKEVPYDAFGDHAPIEGKSIEGDYISREAVLGCLYKTMESYHVKRNIMDIPAADVRPVVRARLKYRHTKNGYGLFCTNCGELWTARKIGKYCYNCGSDMSEYFMERKRRYEGG